MDLDWLEDFLALTGAENFSRAAEARHVTQPAFSRRIQMLERWVGTPLFLRAPRRVVLTAAGTRFHALVEMMPRKLAHARGEALEAAGRSTRALAIAATHALSFTFFPQWARSVLAVADAGPVNLISDNMDACEDLMLRGEASFLLCHRHASAPGRLEARAFRHVRVGRDVLVPVVAPDVSGTPLWQVRTRSSSPNVPHLGYAAQSGLGRILDADWQRRGLDLNLQSAVTARLAAALQTMAENGDGVAWLPRTLAADSLKSGRLVRADDGTLETQVDITLVRPVARLSESAEALWSRVRGQV